MYNDIIYLFLSVSVLFILYFFNSVLLFTPVNAFISVQLSLSFSLPLLLFSEWLLFHVGCPCWKNKSNVVFTLKSHCFHDYKKKRQFLISESFTVTAVLFFFRERKELKAVSWCSASHCHLTSPHHTARR